MNFDLNEAILKKRLIAFSDGPKLIQKELDAATEDIKAAEESFKNDSYKWASIQGYYAIFHVLTLLSSIFTKGINWDLCLINPCKKIKRLKEIQKPYRWWRSRNDITKFLIATKDHPYYLLYRIALETGMRLGELAGLLWSSIDFETGRVELSQQYNEHTRSFLPLKNSRCRVVWLPDATLTLLRTIKLASDAELVFCQEGGKPISNTSVGKTIFVRLQKKAGVPIINFHALRHTYASHFMMNGGSLYDLSKLLGHSSIDITEIYAHLSEEAIRKNRNRVSFSVENVFSIESRQNHANG